MKFIEVFVFPYILVTWFPDLSLFLSISFDTLWITAYFKLSTNKLADCSLLSFKWTECSFPDFISEYSFSNIIFKYSS